MSAPRRIHVLGAARPEPTDKPTTPTHNIDERELQRITRFVERLAAAQFFGKLTLSFQNGKITDLRTEQAMKIDDI